MKYCKNTTLKENTAEQKMTAKTAALRLINDIALIDVDLATQLKPGIDMFVENLDASIDNNEMLNKLAEFFTLQSTTDKAEWLKQNKTVADAVKTIMDSMNTNDATKLTEDDDFEPGLLDEPEQEFGLDDDVADDDELQTLDDLPDVMPSVADAKDTHRTVLAKMQLENKIRQYIEKSLAEFINEKVKASIVASNVDGYDATFATSEFNDSLDTAFNRVLDTLTDTLLANFNK